MAPQFRRLGSSRWLVEFINEWREFGPHLNWRTFHPLMLEIEDDRMMGAVEFTLIILMLGIRVRLTYTDTDFTAELAAHVESIMSWHSSHGEARPWRHSATRHARRNAGQVRLHERGRDSAPHPPWGWQFGMIAPA